jgi:hypothetical protein
MQLVALSATNCTQIGIRRQNRRMTMIEVEPQPRIDTLVP